MTKTLLFGIAVLGLVGGISLSNQAAVAHTENFCVLRGVNPLLICDTVPVPGNTADLIITGGNTDCHIFFGNVIPDSPRTGLLLGGGIVCGDVHGILAPVNYRVIGPL